MPHPLEGIMSSSSHRAWTPLPRQLPLSEAFISPEERDWLFTCATEGALILTFLYMATLTPKKYSQSSKIVNCLLL